MHYTNAKSVPISEHAILLFFSLLDHSQEPLCTYQQNHDTLEDSTDLIIQI